MKTKEEQTKENFAREDARRQANKTKWERRQARWSKWKFEKASR